MRIISTLLCFISCFGIYAQTPVTGCREIHLVRDSAGVSVKNGLTGPIQGLQIEGKKDQTNNTRIILRCPGTRMPNNCGPLLVVDGEIWQRDRLISLNPNDIKTIEVLKSAAATAIYGPDGVYGALIFTLKTVRDVSITVMDNLDKSFLSKATVTFVIPVRNDTLRYIADDNGKIVTNSARELLGCRMIISAVGYRPESRTWSDEMIMSDQQIFLSRDTRQCEEAVLSPAVCWRRIISCGNRITNKIAVQEDNNGVTRALKVFPNPARRGEQVSIVFDAENTEALNLRVLNAAGNNLHTQSIRPVKGSNRITVHTNPAWAAGIYYIRVMHEDGREAGSGRIIIQQ